MAAPRPSDRPPRGTAIDSEAHSPGGGSRTFVGRTLTVIGLAALVVALGLVLWKALDIVILAFVAVLLAVALATPASAIAARTRLPRWLALALVTLSLVGLVGAGAWILGEHVVDELGALADDLPRILERLEGVVVGMPGSDWLLARLEAAEPADIAGIGMIGRVGDALAGAIETLVRIVFVAFLALFLASAPDTYRDGLVRLAPPRSRSRARQVLDEVGTTIQGWILGQLVSMLLVGVLATVGLLLLGIPYALLLGLVAGIAELVPIFGPLFAYVPALLVALATGPEQALWVTALYLVIQQLEGNLIQPTVQRLAVDLPQALTVAAVLLGGALFGPIGLFIATPLMAIVLVLVKMLYLHDLLGDPVDLPGGVAER